MLRAEDNSLFFSLALRMKEPNMKRDFMDFEMHRLHMKQYTKELEVESNSAGKLTNSWHWDAGLCQCQYYIIYIHVYIMYI